MSPPLAIQAFLRGSATVRRSTSGLRLRYSHDASGPSSKARNRGRRTDAMASRRAGMVVGTCQVRPGVLARVLTQIGR